MKKNILVLGGAGFIGSYIIRELLKQEEVKITIIDNFSKYGVIHHDFFDDPRVEVKVRDVRVMYPSEYKGYDLVICLAALIGGIQYFHKIPYQIARDNNEILAYAIDNTLTASPDALFVYTSSSMVYERVQTPVTEKDTYNQMIPFTNYGMQKLYGEYLVRGAHQEFGLRYLIIRPFNAVGSGELPETNRKGEVQFGMAHVIPDFVYRALVKQTPFEMLGDGKQVRTFTHAKDIAEAFLLTLEKEIVNEDFNFCGLNTYDVMDLAQLIWKKVNPETPFPQVHHHPAPEADVRFRVGKSEKAKKMLGWTPRYDMDYVVNDTLAFIRKNFEKVQKTS